MRGFDLEMRQLSTGNTIGKGFVFDKKQQKEMRVNNAKAVNYKGSLYFSKASDSNAEINRKNTIIDRAVKQSRLVTDPQGITVLDFDDTLATSKSLIEYKKTDGTEGTLTPAQYARDYQSMLGEGTTFDFSQFNKVVDGKVAPLFQKALKLQSKFGNNDMFVLTARPSESAPAIFAFLKANGLNIPLENITGLANSTSEAKALWIAEKVGDGYNDFYFADDALQNVQAVDNMLEQFDVKRKVQLAKINLFSKASEDFNIILEETSAVNRFAEFSDAKAQKRGAGKGKYNIFIPASAEDFKGLLYKFLGKGAKGDAHMKFFTDTLINPFSRAIRELDGKIGRAHV
jgi:predicted DNA-binding protein